MLTLPEIAAAYVQATNNHDGAGFMACFAEDAVVDDAGRVFHGSTEIKSWSEREIIEAQVVLEVLDATERDGEVIISTKVDGNFDRTGLPDPLIIDHHLKVENNKIVHLACRLAGTE